MLDTRAIGKRPQLDKKLAAYALAGAALAVPGAAEAAVVTVQVNTTVNQPGSYALNLSGPATGDITLWAQTGTSFPAGNPTNEVRVATALGAQVVSSGVDPSALAFGAVIDPASGTWGSGGKLASWDTVSLGCSGGWGCTNGQAYLGFYFQVAGAPHAGWALIQTSANDSGASFRLLQYAYETDPNTAITAGEGQVPEPASMALIALGGIGLIALRRRRAANG